MARNSFWSRAKPERPFPYFVIERQYALSMPDPETSEILVSREFFFIFTSRSRSRAVSNSLSLLEKEWRDFIFHFSPLEKSESYPCFTLFLEKKEWNQVRVITSPLSLFPLVFPNIVKSQVSISLKILAKFQFLNLDQTLCSMSEQNFN